MSEMRKYVLIDTIGQLPILGGITGPILRPFYLDTSRIRTLLAFRVSVKEVKVDENGKPILRKGKYITQQLNFDNYDKKIDFPETKKKFFYNNEKRNQKVAETPNTVNIKSSNDETKNSENKNTKK